MFRKSYPDVDENRARAEGNARHAIFICNWHEEKGSATAGHLQARAEAWKVLASTSRGSRARLSSMQTDYLKLLMRSGKLQAILVYSCAGLVLFFSFFFIFSILVHAAQGMAMARP